MPAGDYHMTANLPSIQPIWSTFTPVLETPMKDLPNHLRALPTVYCRDCGAQMPLNTEPSTCLNTRVFLIEQHVESCIHSDMNGERTWEDNS